MTVVGFFGVFAFLGFGLLIVLVVIVLASSSSKRRDDDRYENPSRGRVTPRQSKDPLVIMLVILVLILMIFIGMLIMRIYGLQMENTLLDMFFYN